jgi:hypothetical protein
MCEAWCWDEQAAEKGIDRPGGLSHVKSKSLILRRGTGVLACHFQGQLLLSAAC